MFNLKKNNIKDYLYYLDGIDIYINLKNVTYIKFDKKHLKIIFSYDYSIQIKNVLDSNDNQKVIPDYTYYNFDNIEQYEENAKRLINYIHYNILEYKYYKDETVEFLINFSKISFIKFKENRAIINFNNSASFKDDEGVSQVTGYFIYIDLTNSKIQDFKRKIDRDIFELF